MRFFQILFVLLTACLVFSTPHAMAQEAPNSLSPQSFQDEANPSLRFEVVQAQLILDSSKIEKAELKSDEFGRASVAITLNEETAKKLYRMTKNALGKSANIVLDHNILSTAVIRSELQGSFLVTGLTKESAERLIKVLSKQ